MKFMINHQTYYQYSEPVKNSIQYIKMIPQNNTHQQVRHWNISIPGESTRQRDIFDNVWLTASQRFEYSNLMIMAQGVIEINEKNRFGIDSNLAPIHYLQATSYTHCTVKMYDFANKFVPSISAKISKQHLIALSEAILKRMPYIPQSTLVTHTAQASFEMRQGVCQDHTHVFIAMVRALGIPVRYVSGYLFVNDQTHLASHAWAEAYLDGKWHCFDISNQIFQPHSHIYIATGRDYWDVAPVRGVRLQGGTESMHSMVQVLAC